MKQGSRLHGSPPGLGAAWAGRRAGPTCALSVWVVGVSVRPHSSAACSSHGLKGSTCSTWPWLEGSQICSEGGWVGGGGVGEGGAAVVKGGCWRRGLGYEGTELSGAWQADRQRSGSWPASLEGLG